MIFSKEIKDSPTLKMAELAKQKEKEGKEIISLAIGQPDFKTPKYIIDKTKEGLDLGYTTYSTPQGLIELREAISKDFKGRYHSSYEANEILIFPGAKNAIFTALSSLLEPKDEVIIISPYYVSYPPMIKLAEPTSKIIDIPLNEDYSLPVSKIKSAINKHTKVLILNYPNNPTGQLLNKEEVLEIINIIKKTNVYLISDEIYDELIYEGNKFISFSSYKEIKNNLIVINGFSKTYAMTGFRLGYVLSSEKIIKKMNLMNQNTNTNTNTFSQYGALAIYENENTHLKKYNQKLSERAQFFHEEINKTKYFKGIKPMSSFYYFINISETKLTDLKLSKLLIDKYGLVVTPGSSFGEKFKKYIRISLAVEKEILEKAINIFKSLSL